VHFLDAANQRFLANLQTKRALYYVALGLVLASAFGLRALGFLWQCDMVDCNLQNSMHPDENSLLSAASRFFNVHHKYSYPPGFTAHIVVLQPLLSLSPLLIARATSLGYGVATVLLVAVAVRKTGGSSKRALLAALVLALAPLHVVNSHFGTADAMAAFYFLLTALLAFRFAERPTMTRFVALVIAASAAVVTKFFISAWIPVIWAILAWPKRGMRLLVAPVLFMGTFTILSLGTYSYPQFQRFSRGLQNDNISIAAGNAPFEQVLAYLHEVPTSLGLLSTLLASIGAGVLCANLRTLRSDEPWPSLSAARALSFLRNPWVLFFGTIGAHAAAVSLVRVHFSRHLIPLLPGLAMLAAVGAEWTFSKMHRRLPTVALLGFMFFGVHSVLGWEQLFRSDLRKQADTWLNQHAGPKSVSFSHGYAAVPGSKLFTQAKDPGDIERTRFFVMTDLDYFRYMGDPRKPIYHSGSTGWAWLHRTLLSSTPRYPLAVEFRQPTRTLERWLIEKGFLKTIFPFSPEHYAIYKIPSK
jgi:hypothetical protein